MRNVQKFLPVVLAFVIGSLVGFDHPWRWVAAFFGGGLVMMGWQLAAHWNRSPGRTRRGALSSAGFSQGAQAKLRARHQAPLYEERA